MFVSFFVVGLLAAAGCSGDDEPDARIPLAPEVDAPPADAAPAPDAAPDA